MVDKCRQRRFADAPYTGQHQGRGVWIDQPAIDSLYDMFALLNGATVSGGRQTFNATV